MHNKYELYCIFFVEYEVVFSRSLWPSVLGAFCDTSCVVQMIKNISCYVDQLLTVCIELQSPSY